MYFVLYDRFLNSIGQTYILESWSRIQRATDFDELSIIGEQIPYSANPFFVVVNDKQGKTMFSGLASTPSIDDQKKKTHLSLKDYMTLFNSDIVVDWSKFSGNTVGSYLEFILSLWKSQIDIGFGRIFWDVSGVENLLLDSEIHAGDSVENVLSYTLILDALNYYDLYCTPYLDVYNKSLTFYFHKSSTNPISIRLRDFGIQMIEKSFGEYNRVTVYTSDYTKYQEWSLTEKNEIVRSLPHEYQEVEYIEGTGSQYINTRHIPSGNGSRYILEFMYTRDMSGLSVFGNSSGPPYDVTLFNRPYGQLLFIGDTPNIDMGFGLGVIGEKYDLDIEAKDGIVTSVCNGVKNSSTYSGSLNNTKEVYIFRSNNAEYANGCRIFSFKIYDSGLLVRNYVPCYRKSDGKIGMYDLVDNEFYTNSGTEEFLRGKDFSNLVYPAKNRNIIAQDDLYSAVYDAVMGLAGNRYQENIDLDVNRYKSILDLTSIDFSYRVKVYTDEGYYKDLPVGEIETDSNGKHIVRLGHRVQELTQEL